jgi:hypothetical protein
MDVGLAWRMNKKLGLTARAFADFLSLSISRGA